MTKQRENQYRGTSRRRDRNQKLNEKTIRETEDFRRTGISILTLFAGDDSLVPEIYACFRFARPTTPKEFHSIVSEALKKEGMI